MSVQVMGWVLEESETKGEERLVLLAIANHADVDGGSAWPSIAQIAREANVHRDTAKRLIRKLHRGGHITRLDRAAPDERIPHHKRPNLYAVVLSHEEIRRLRDERLDEGDPGDDTSPGDVLTPGDDTSPGDVLTPLPGGRSDPLNHPYTTVPKKTSFARSGSRGSFEVDFEEWWAAYPRKIAKDQAKRTYTTRRRGGVPAADLLAAAQRYATDCRSEGRDPKWIKHGGSFLNNGWEDWVPGGAADREALAGTQAPKGTSYVAANGVTIRMAPGVR